MRWSIYKENGLSVGKSFSLCACIEENKKRDALSASLRAGEEGFEPPLTVLETAALPLYYSPICLVVLPTNCIIARNNSKGKGKMQFFSLQIKRNGIEYV